MTIARLPFRLGPLISITVFAAVLSMLPYEAFARGGSGAARAYQRMWQQQMKFMQTQTAAMEKQEKEQYDAFMKRFDTNKNGKIDGKEKSPAQKYLRKLEMGIDPDKSIKSMGRSSSSFGPRTKAKSTSAKSK